MAGLAAQKDPFGWFTPKTPPSKVNLRSQIGGPVDDFEEYEETERYNNTQATESLDQYNGREEIKAFSIHGSLVFQETRVQKETYQESNTPQAASILATFVEKQTAVIPDVGEKLVKATELTGKATQDVAEAGWDLLKIIFGFEKKPKKSEKKEDPQKIQENQRKQQLMNETAQKVTAVTKERMVKNSLEDYRKQVNKVLGITGSYEGTMDENGQLRTDIKISFEKSQAQQEEAAEKSKKDQEMAAVRPKGKPGQGVDLRQNAMTEKTAGGSALTTVG